MRVDFAVIYDQTILVDDISSNHEDQHSFLTKQLVVSHLLNVLVVFGGVKAGSEKLFVFVGSVLPTCLFEPCDEDSFPHDRQRFTAEFFAGDIQVCKSAIGTECGQLFGDQTYDFSRQSRKSMRLSQSRRNGQSQAWSQAIKVNLLDCRLPC